ncbi:MAG: hypothetical protein WBE41_15110, partial [Terracidiphilus sp.]
HWKGSSKAPVPRMKGLLASVSRLLTTNQNADKPPNVEPSASSALSQARLPERFLNLPLFSHLRQPFVACFYQPIR